MDVDWCVHVAIFLVVGTSSSSDFTVTSIMTVVLCPATASALRENTVLTELSLWYCGIDAEGISHLAQALRVNTTLRVLYLSGNTVDSQGAEHLGELSGWGLGLWAHW